MTLYDRLALAVRRFPSEEWLSTVEVLRFLGAAAGSRMAAFIFVNPQEVLHALIKSRAISLYFRGSN